jgi:predicted small secreted protein
MLTTSQKRFFKKSLLLSFGAALIASLTTLSTGCNTIGGAGKDISNLGSDISAGAGTVSRAFKKDS